MDNTLSTWLNGEIRERGWSERELARRAGVSHTAINNALTGQYKTRLDTYKGIARAFGMPLDRVLRAAGELQPLPPAAQREEEATQLFRQIPAAYQDLAIRVLREIAETPGQPVADIHDLLQPGQSIAIRQWEDHPLIAVLVETAGWSQERIMAWLLEHFAADGPRQVKEREESPV